MTDYNATVVKELLPELLSSHDGLAKLIETVDRRYVSDHMIMIWVELG